MASQDLPLVLVIDDEVGPRESLRILLKNEYRVICVSSVDEGLERLDEAKPDAVVLDIRMPGKNGIEGLREIRERDPYASVMMLTGYGTLETAQEALRLGATDYLKKPFDTDQMQDKIKRCVERTRLERRSGEAAGRLRKLNKRLVNDLAQMEEYASLGQASEEFVHDLRNPLTIVLGYVELLTEQLRGVKDLLGGHYGDTLRYIDVINSNAERCKELADTWRNFGETENENVEQVGIGELLDSVREGIEYLAASCNAAVEYEMGVNGARVTGRRSQLARAVQNVVSNAIQAAPEDGGKIRVVGRENEDWVEIEVTDNGSGIPSEIMSRVFDPYFTTKKDGEGTGLGLAITKRIIENCHGTLSIESEPGKGTTVHMRLPLADGK